jgi:hypothetical protein
MCKKMIFKLSMFFKVTELNYESYDVLIVFRPFGKHSNYCDFIFNYRK